MNTTVFRKKKKGVWVLSFGQAVSGHVFPVEKSRAKFSVVDEVTDIVEFSVDVSCMSVAILGGSPMHLGLVCCHSEQLWDLHVEKSRFRWRVLENA